jgi:hypothetical protein
MDIRDQPLPKETREPELSRAEEGRRVIKEYADDLRMIIRMLRRHLN